MQEGVYPIAFSHYFPIAATLTCLKEIYQHCCVIDGSENQENNRVPASPLKHKTFTSNETKVKPSIPAFLFPSALALVNLAKLVLLSLLATSGIQIFWILV